MPIWLTNDKYRGRLRGAWISSPADTNLLVDSLPTNIPTIVVAGYGTASETVFSVTGSSGTNASNYVLTGVTRLRGANTNLPENTTLHCIAVEEFFNQYAGVASTASGIANLTYGIDSGSNDSYAVDLAVSPGSYASGLTLNFLANTTNTGAATIDINGMGVKDIKNVDGSDLASGQIATTSVASIVYNGTYFVLQSWDMKSYVDSPIKTATDGATVTFDLGNGAYRKHKVVLGGNRTLAISNAKVGQAFIIDLTQDATGSRTVTWFTTIKWADGSAPTLTTTANKIDTFGFICTSAGNYQGYIIGQNL